MSTDDRDGELQRLANLETVVRALRAEVAELRARVDAGSTSASSSASTSASTSAYASEQEPAAAPASPFPGKPIAAPHKLDLEKLIGRYGTLAVAALAILLGVGAFLQWAISRDLLGPEARVALGAVAALVLAGLGMRLRSRGSARFGDVLLALSLAVVHVVAWAAGPSLQIIDASVALGIAAAASVLLASLALRDRHETLFAIGMGGALLAPFVTSDGGGNVVVLLVYGWVVSTAAITALRDPSWVLSRRLLGIFGAGYAGSALTAIPSMATDAVKLAPATMLIGLAVSTILLAEREGRRALGRSFLSLSAIFLAAASVRAASDWSPLRYAVIATIALYALRRRAPIEPDEEGAGSAFDAVLLPIAFAGAALVPWIDKTSVDPVKVVAVWIAFGVVASVTAPRVQLGLHLALALLAAAVAVLVAPDNDLRDVALLASIAAAASLLISSEGRRVLLFPMGVGLLSSALLAFGLLDDRPRYEYTPFIGVPSLAALLATLGWLAASFWATRGVMKSDRLAFGSAAEVLAAPMRIAGPFVAFLWFREEFAYAFSADIAVFLLISYYAVLGVVMIGVGRRRSVAALRNVGLAMALYAGLKAGAQASDIDAIGWRVASYLIVGAFLLGVGYWYRARDAEGDRPDEANARES